MSGANRSTGQRSQTACLDPPERTHANGAYQRSHDSIADAIGCFHQQDHALHTAETSLTKTDDQQHENGQHEMLTTGKTN